jgi:hypothetical protein
MGRSKKDIDSPKPVDEKAITKAAKLIRNKFFLMKDIFIIPETSFFIVETICAIFIYSTTGKPSASRRTDLNPGPFRASIAKRGDNESGILTNVFFRRTKTSLSGPSGT